MSGSAERLRLRSADAQRVLLVHAVESVDPRGLLLPNEARQAATRRARQGADRASAGSRKSAVETARWLAARARTLSDILERETDSRFRRLREVTDPGRGWLGAAILVGSVVGLLTNALGPSRQVHILALPLLGILIWNLVILVAIAVRAILPGAPQDSKLVDRARSLIARLAKKRFDREARAEKDHGASIDGASVDAESTRGRILRRAADRYLEDWLPSAAPLIAARLERALHGGALALAAGVVAGMYLRGLAFEYRAGWESTFLSAGAVESLVNAVLGPASRLSGIEIPPVETLRQTGETLAAETLATGNEAPSGLGNAAPWIHLWAITTGMVVGLPRLLFFVIASLKSAHRGRRLSVPVPAAYLRRLLSAVDPASRRVDILAYSHRLSSAAVTKLKTAVFDVFGARADIHLRHLAYGDELEAPKDEAARCRILVFNLAQTPEAEVHGALAGALADATVAGQALITTVESGAYRARLGEGSEQRIDDRFRAWERILGASVIRLDLESPSILDPATLFTAAWPEGALDDLRSRT